MKKIFYTAALSLLFYGCGGGGSENPATTPVQLINDVSECKRIIKDELGKKYTVIENGLEVELYPNEKISPAGWYCDKSSSSCDVSDNYWGCNLNKALVDKVNNDPAHPAYICNATTGTTERDIREHVSGCKTQK